MRPCLGNPSPIWTEKEYYLERNVETPKRPQLSFPDPGADSANDADVTGR